MQSDPTDDAAMALEDGPVDAPRSSIWRIDLAVAIILTGCTAFWGDLVGTGLRSHYYLASVPIAGYWVARWADGHESRLIVLAGGVGSILGPVRWSVDDPIGSMSPELLPILAPVIALCLAWTITPYLLGRRDRETAVARQERELAAQERYESELVKRDQQTRMIEARVRTDIARELHDVVAQSLSVMIVQADGGKALARTPATTPFCRLSSARCAASWECCPPIPMIRSPPTSSRHPDCPTFPRWWRRPVSASSSR